MTPDQRLREQAAFCRSRWHSLGPEGRVALARKLDGGDELDRAWADVLRGRHLLSRWLDGDENYDQLPSFPPPTARQLISSHPFRVEKPWSSPSTSEPSSSMPRG